MTGKGNAQLFPLPGDREDKSNERAKGLRDSHSVGGLLSPLLYYGRGKVAVIGNDIKRAVPIGSEVAKGGG